VGLDGAEPPLTRVEDIAERHIASIWPVAGAGPYYLAGHSFGACVAVEMSRQLVARGATLGCLAIFDAYAPLATARNAYWQSWDDVDWLLAIAHNVGSFLGASLELTRADLEVRSPEDRLALMVTRIASRGSWLSDTAPERLRAYLNVYQANYKAVYAPAAEALDVPITLFRSTEADAQDIEPSAEFARLRADPTWGWSHFSRFPVEVIDVPGTHLAMLLEPHVGPLAARLNELLIKASR
jgi:thioesterase domain-containing protein